MSRLFPSHCTLTWRPSVLQSRLYSIVAPTGLSWSTINRVFHSIRIIWSAAHPENFVHHEEAQSKVYKCQRAHSEHASHDSSCDCIRVRVFKRWTQSRLHMCAHPEKWRNSRATESWRVLRMTRPFFPEFVDRARRNPRARAACTKYRNYFTTRSVSASKRR